MMGIGLKREHRLCAQDTLDLAHLIGHRLCQAIGIFDSDDGNKVISATHRVDFRHALQIYKCFSNVVYFVTFRL